MSLKDRCNQRGAMPTFIIIGVILAFGLAGGIYFLKKHGEQVRQDKIIASLEQKQINESKISEEVAKTSSTNDANPKTSNILPETGIEFDIVRLIGLCLITMSISSYVSSRRNLAGHL